MNIKEIRHHIMYTQEELAEALKCSLYTVQRWEQNKSKPSLRHKRAIIDLCLSKNYKCKDE